MNIDTTNHFLVGLRGNRLELGRGVHALNRQQAYNLAAWLVTMAQALPTYDDCPNFEEVLTAVQNT